jgi:hypothetical protein
MPMLIPSLLILASIIVLIMLNNSNDNDLLCVSGSQLDFTSKNCVKCDQDEFSISETDGKPEPIQGYGQCGECIQDPSDKLKFPNRNRTECISCSPSYHLVNTKEDINPNFLKEMCNYKSGDSTTAAGADYCCPCPNGHEPSDEPDDDSTRKLLSTTGKSVNYTKAGMTIDNDHLYGCKPCDDNSAGINGSCKQCPDGQQPNDDKTACILCDEQFIGVGGTCTTEFCEKPQAPNADRTKCVNCPSDQIWEYGICRPCPDKEVPDSTGTVCVPVDSIITDPSQCPSNNKAQPEVNGDTYTCTPCPEHTVVDIQNNRSSCIGYDHRLYMLDGETKIPIPQNKYYDDTSKTLQECPAHHQRPLGGVSCEPCDDNYHRDEGSPSCNICPWPQWSKSGNDCMPECSPGYFLDKTAPNYTCSPCDYTKGEYSSVSTALICEKCPMGYNVLPTIKDETGANVAGVGCTKEEAAEPSLPLSSNGKVCQRNTDCMGGFCDTETKTCKLGGNCAVAGFTDQCLDAAGNPGGYCMSKFGGACDTEYDRCLCRPGPKLDCWGGNGAAWQGCNEIDTPRQGGYVNINWKP